MAATLSIPRVALAVLLPVSDGERVDMGPHTWTLSTSKADDPKLSPTLRTLNCSEWRPLAVKA